MPEITLQNIYQVVPDDHPEYAACYNNNSGGCAAGSSLWWSWQQWTQAKIAELQADLNRRTVDPGVTDNGTILPPDTGVCEAGQVPLPDVHTNDGAGHLITLPGRCVYVTQEDAENAIVTGGREQCHVEHIGGGDSPYGQNPGGYVITCNTPTVTGNQQPVNPQAAGCCDGQNKALADIAAVLNKIVAELAKKQQDVCTIAEQCLDKIIDGINKKYSKVFKTCEQCQQEVCSGVANNLEHVIACANCISADCKSCNDKNKTDYPNDGSVSNSVVEQPCDQPTCDQPQEQQQYTGWYDPNTGQVAARRKGSEPPSYDAILIGTYDTEQAAIAAASANARVSVTTGYESRLKDFKPNVGHQSDFCSTFTQDVSQFIPQVISGHDALNLTATIRQKVVRTIDDLGAFEHSLPIIGEMLGGIKQLFLNPIRILTDSLPDIAAAAGCNSTEFQSLIYNRAMVGLVEKWTGSNLSEYMTASDYAINMACRRKNLGPDEAIAAFLANVINDSSLDNYHAIAGICPQDVKVKILASQSRPVPQQLSQLRRRDVIDVGQYQEGMRSLGYLNGDSNDTLYSLSETRPTPGDIIRFMTRDTADNTLAIWGEADKLFPQKYNGILQRWAKDQGVSDAAMFHAWRAHFELPSPSQLYEMLRRLRDDKRFGGKDKLEKDVRDALIQQDILPYWLEHFIAISYRELTLRDLYRGYTHGALDDDGLLKGLKKQGYSDDDAKTIREMYADIKLRDGARLPAIKLWLKHSINRGQAEARVKKSGYNADQIKQLLDDAEIGFLQSPYVKAYIGLRISKQSLITLLSGEGVTNNSIDKIILIASLHIKSNPAFDDLLAGMIDSNSAMNQATADGLSRDVASFEIDVVKRKIARTQALACAKSIKSRFIHGAIDDREATDLVSSAGFTNQQAGVVVSSWKCQVAAKEKAVTAQKLCHWVELGIITSTDMKKRLIKIGYSETDANYIIQDCLTAINTKQSREAKRQAAEDVRNQEKADRLGKQADAAALRQLAQLERNRKAAAKARSMRERQLLSFSEKVSNKCECSLADSVDYAKLTRDRIMRAYGLSVDDTMQVLLVSIDKWAGGQLPTLDTVIDTFAAEAASVPV